MRCLSNFVLFPLISPAPDGSRSQAPPPMGSYKAVRRETSWRRPGETEAERADRNFADLLQELRITLTGAQILFAFLLVVPFNSEFRHTTSLEHGVYVGTLVGSALSAGLLVAPAAMHRVLFRQQLKDRLVVVAGTLAIAGQSLFAVSLAEGVFLVVDFLYGLAPGLVLGLALLAWYLGWFFLVPWGIRRREEDGGAL